MAIHLKEPGYELLIEAIEGAALVVVGIPTLLETTMVLSSRLKVDARPLVTGFLRRIHAELVPFNDEHLEAATSAFLRFGRGRHPAGLNFGDCMSYAVSAVARMPLLFTGADFSRTDLEAGHGR